MRRFENKIALVTGGSKGIGRAIVQEFVQEGATVLINYAHNIEPASVLAAEIEAAGGHAYPLEANVEDVDSVKDLFAQIKQRFGTLDILVNNAGFGAMRPIETLALRHFERAMALNCRAVLQCSQEATHLMNEGGKIVNISSVGGQKVLPQYAAIGTSKAAMEMLTRYLAVELASKNIAVNAVSSGPVLTEALQYFHNSERAIISAQEQTAVGRLNTAQDVAKVVSFLCSEDAFMIRGQTITVDGGLSLIIHVY